MAIDLNRIYKNKKIFITGHTGFKGSWLISWLHLLGADIKGYALAPENSFDLYNAIDGDKLCQSVIADIRDVEKLKSELLAFQPDFVFHLAAQPIVRVSYNIPLDTFSVNCVGTACILESLRFLEKPCVVVMITTDKVYHNQEKNYFYKEEDRLGGYDPYSASKAASELIIDSYRKSFLNPDKYENHQKSVSVARAGNVIGGGDWAKDRIMPDIIRSLNANQSIPIRNPFAIRPWQHVLEPLCGYLTLGAKQIQNPILFADAFNFGPYPTDNLLVKEIVQKAIQVWGTGDFNVISNKEDVHEAELLQLDITKATKILDWHPLYNAEIALEKTVLWYKNLLLQNENAQTLINNDIKDFTSILNG